ncbi:cryptochrome/photolyase family protein [Arcticibacter tournemirensis]|uniref:Deoxyribodipyrimidine photo-lyase n=1 Tax=Arcticibacter tournemirensis TaxID=699437 RepID=A0A4Q0M5X1_9SPHI|nr:deoxyribodipyrimidine photo-lyase [Arcticibacter tournemirensis]RXF68365.1 deoxyribodipyrimidine photo-lyase [Arcticibacter tournemirensis]
MEKSRVNLFWFRRDLRLHDNAGLYHALKAGLPVLPLFIFDRNILDKLQDKDDARVTFIFDALEALNKELVSYGSSLVVKYNFPERAWEELTGEFNIQQVFTNNDYEPYALERDAGVLKLLAEKSIPLLSFKDHVIFEKDEVKKDDKQPYTVFSAYKRKWHEILKPQQHFSPYPTESYFHNFHHCQPLEIPGLKAIGFQRSSITFPSKHYEHLIANYKETRDIPGIEGTTKIGIHLRFGTLNIRDLARSAYAQPDDTWLSELIWRDFYAMILWHFPTTTTHSFKKEFDNINWRNNEKEFLCWCEGKTGYPIVDAGMRQLNESGWMHNRVRMITASFLTKHLLIDWRWGEAYFARKLLDYDMASNIGGWQWAAGSGNDAVPYFRVFNPELQTKKFDPQFKYIKKWVPEVGDPFTYPQPIVEHTFARQRALTEFRKALASKF